MMLAQPLHNQRVVLIADDETLQRHVASALSRSFANLDVQGTQNADEALHLLEDERSRLLITDAQSSRLDGIAVATSARQRRPTLPVIVMSNAGRGNRPAKTLPLSAIWLAKPPKPERLVGLVRRFLAVPVGFSGEISLDSLPELIQLLCMTNVSGALHVERGAQRGSIFFDHGMIVDAVSGGSHGVSVFNQMLRWQGGLFALDRDARADQRSIDIPAMQLLLDGVSTLDQQRSTLPPGADDGDVFGAWPEERTSNTRRMRLLSHSQAVAKEEAPVITTPEAAQAAAAQSFQRGMELALLKNYDAAVREWERATALDPSQRTYQVNLRRLYEVRRRSARSGGANGDEE
jgi:CheY-like chemotaxis protein